MEACDMVCGLVGEWIWPFRLRVAKDTCGWQNYAFTPDPLMWRKVSAPFLFPTRETNGKFCNPAFKGLTKVQT